MRAGELDPLIYAESAQYLPAQGFATYVLRIATSGAPLAAPRNTPRLISN